MKIAVIGGGSTYTPELVSGFLEKAAALSLEELWLMDPDPQRLEIVGGFAGRMVSARGSPFRVVLSNNRRAAIQGAAYVIIQLRVGKMAARREDEYLGRRHGLIGQETTGVGGMAKALRTIPVVLEVAAELRELAPGALLLNFTNPAGLVTQALASYAPDISAVGVCNEAITTKMRLLDGLTDWVGRKIDAQQAVLSTLGLNHLTWHYGLHAAEEDLWPVLFPAYLAALRRDPDPEWDPDTIETLGMIPNGYLQYFYETARKVEEQKHWPPSRAEAVMEIEGGLLRQYADPALAELPAGLMKRGGAYYSTLATELVDAHCNDRGWVHVANVLNRGAEPRWPGEWVIELPCRIDRQGVHPLPARSLPPACRGLVAQVKAYELHTVEAALHGDRKEAHLALLAHPLGPPASRVSAVLDDLLETNRAYLPQFD